MSRATREDIDEVIGIIHTFMEQVDERFRRVDERLDGLDSKYDRLLNTIDGFIARIDKYETELAARDSQFEKLVT